MSDFTPLDFDAVIASAVERLKDPKLDDKLKAFVAGEIAAALSEVAEMVDRATAPSFLEFVEVDSGQRVTRIWRVQSAYTHRPLGEVRWYAPWRRYCLYPRDDTVWSPACLGEVKLFCEDQTQARKEERAK